MTPVDGSAEDVEQARISRALTSGHREIQENQKGVSYSNLFGAYLKGASKVIVQDPYVRMFHQLRNFAEFLELIIGQKEPADEVTVHLRTGQDEAAPERQEDDLQRLADYARGYGVDVTWEFDPLIHDRGIESDTGWKIVLGRGLDIFQRYDSRDALNPANRIQEARGCKAFGITFVEQS